MASFFLNCTRRQRPTNCYAFSLKCKVAVVNFQLQYVTAISVRVA